MKRNLKLLVLIWLLIQSVEIFAQNQPTGSNPNISCGPNTSCFQTEILKAEKTGENCTAYQFKISYDSRCLHALSHFTVAIPCGDVKDLSNSQNWQQVFGYDPTTKLTGFKIDNIPNFGETSLKSFTVSFTLCTGNACDSTKNCWQPIIAYKAATNVYYDTLVNSCPSSLVANIEKHDASCFGLADGTLSAIVTDGKAPFTYSWSNGATTSAITGLAAGNYSVLIKDANGSSLQLSSTISQPNEIIITGTVNNPVCTANGSIDITPSGGSGGFTYTWSNGATTQDLSGLQSGTYSVTVKDSTGCAVQKSFTLTNTNQIIITPLATQPGCNQSNGSINITVTGGTAPYTFVWSNGATTEDIQNLPPNTYKVTVTDSTGCSASLSYVLRENNTLKLNAIVKQTSCQDDASGAIDLLVSGGTAPYTFVWSNGGTTEDLTGLTAGIYRVTVTDSNGCTITLQVSVSKKTFQIGNVVTQPLCHGDSTGSITLNPTGGVAPYTYQWINGGTSNSIADLPPGTYTVTVTDATGCSRNVTFVITNPTQLVALGTIGNSQCSAEGSFSIDLTVSGGKAPYTYTWSNGATTQDLDSLSSGTFTVTIQDANGCTIMKEFTVSGGSSSFTCLISPPDSVAACGSTGNILKTLVSGATYQWSVQSADGSWLITQGASSDSIIYTAGTENSSATFSLTITKDGCSQTCSYTAATCSSDSTGTGGGGSGGGGNNETCDECFNSSIQTISENGSCITYKATVSTTGNCEHELSHWDIAIPCGTLQDISNSGNWKMEIGKDPTTGLTGLKVDGVNGFGKTPGSFTVSFTICSDNTSCLESFHNWNPVVAYKAGLCIAYDTLGSGGTNNPGPVCAYPNPFHHDVNFKWTCQEDDYIDLKILDKCGREAHQVFQGNVEKGRTYSFEFSGAHLSDDMYFYMLASKKKKTVYGKLVKSTN
ncbi:MAG TPA: SprB repeat-containing protein [Cyclobacteriaceae bacterium]|jgi:hypothetical protein|nr:SprB repeat-containing protein [Cyclobacteriaceae bacterium]